MSVDHASTIRAALRCGSLRCSCNQGLGNTHCPTHTDKNPSLSVDEKDGIVVVHCFAGCNPNDVMKELQQQGLWIDARRGGGGSATPLKTDATTQQSLGLTVAQYAKAKGLDERKLSEFGLTDIYYQNEPAVRIPYFDATGNDVSAQFRLSLEGSNRFKFKSGSKPILYGQWLIAGCDTSKGITIVEGASDCHTLWQEGFQGIGLPGAANWKDQRDAQLVDSFDVIYVVIEPDKGGDAVTNWLSKSVIRERVRLVSLGRFNDPNELFRDDPARFKERFQTALNESIPWAKHAADIVDEERTVAWEQCRHLAELPEILKRVSLEMQGAGVVGEERTVKLLYLILTSGITDKPKNVSLKGLSSGGKSYIVENTLKFFPSSSYYALTAMSERALAYSDEPLDHRHLVIYEAAGLNSEFASYLIRSLLSEGRIAYDTVEKTSEGLKAKHIEREGPTGLIVTTTSVQLHPENETRMLSITVKDSREQTRKIMLSVAARASGSEYAASNQVTPEMEAWHALQVWLRRSEHRVVIPYAEALADAIPPLAVRLRRDISTLLGLIETHAILHQVTREKDSTGRIIATLADYAVVRELIADLLAEGVEATVSDTVRETVATIHSLNGDVKDATCSTAQVAKTLKLDRATAYRRIDSAINLGHLINIETRKHKPYQVAVGEPLPDKQNLLPTVEALAGCSVAPDIEGLRPPLPSTEQEEVIEWTTQR
jgi:hypothetical protein